MDKCPFCGADKWDGDQRNIYAVGWEEYYDCGTYRGATTYIRKPVCFNRQIANLKERLEAWRELGNSIVHPNDYEMKPAFKKLKDLGEI